MAPVADAGGAALSASREVAFDIARGFAIVAIVAGHVITGVRDAGLLTDGHGLLGVNDALYQVHLVVFAFMAGLFVAGSVARHGRRRYLRQRVTMFAYLYVLWTLLQGLLKVLTNSLVNTPTSLPEVLRLWVPQAQFWFLTFMIVATVLTVWLQPWRESRRLWLPVVGLASLAAWGWSGAYVGLQGLALLVFVVTAAALGSTRLSVLLQRSGVPPAILLGVTSWALFTLILATGQPSLPTVGDSQRAVLPILSGFVASCTGLVAVVVTAALTSRLRRVSDVLAFLGRRSLEIFLAHIMAASSARILLVAAGVDDPVPHVVIGTLVGVVVPLLLVLLTQRLGIPWLFAPPRDLDTAGAPAAPRGST